MFHNAEMQLQIANDRLNELRCAAATQRRLREIKRAGRTRSDSDTPRAAPHVVVDAPASSLADMHALRRAAAPTPFDLEANESCEVIAVADHRAVSDTHAA